MYIVPRNLRSSTTRSTVLGALGLLCCLLCMPPNAQAQVRRAEEAHSAFSAAEPPVGALNRPRPHSLSAQEVTPPQRKKRRIVPADSHNASSVFSLWLTAFSTTFPLPGSSPLGRLEEREHACRLPSWRGFVFFAMPPPRLS